jgi:hypothetical protein
MRAVAAFGAVSLLCAGCIATHEPAVLRGSDAAYPPLPISLRVIPEPSGHPPLDRKLCERAVGDLRATQVFSAVTDCGDSVDRVDLTARVSWHTLRRADDWCTGDRSIALALVTAGIVPACSCESGYALRFVGSADEDVVTVRLDREACTLIGWVPLFLNLRSDYHWYGPADAQLRTQALREQLLKARPELAGLAARNEQPNKPLQPTRAAGPNRLRERARCGPRG